MNFRRSLVLFCLGWGLSCSTAFASPEGRVIVRFKSDATTSTQAARQRVSPLARRSGLALAARNGPAPDTAVVTAEGLDSQALATRLAADADVEYAVPDLRRHAMALPTDPLYAQQWHLQATESAAIHAEQAWDSSTGSSNVVVAVVDTGVRFDHPDLAANLLPGYDFISDPLVANDGDGRDADASDPGDYITQADIDAGYTCVSAPEAAISPDTTVPCQLLASGNNAVGVTGVMWNARILPLRVLGKCGGYDSDIIAAMRWAAGLDVPDVPANTHPARIVNLSLGGEGSCLQSYMDTVTQLNAVGVLVVAAAGNESGVVATPGNCSGVLAVGALRHNGTKVGYSNVGEEVGISAPGGNCGSSAVCQYAMVSTFNRGTTDPGSNDYSGSSDAEVGTSFSTPLVSGVAGLMLSINPDLTRTQLLERLQSSATAFPSEAGLPTCPTMGATGSGIDGQCNCTTTSCGAGMLNAYAAVEAAARPLAAFTSSAGGAGEPITLDATSSTAISGQSVAQWSWTVVSGPGTATIDESGAQKTYLRADTVGTYQVSLTVTDSAGRHDTLTQGVAVATVTKTETHSGGGGGGALGAWTVLPLLGLLMAAYRATRRP